MFYIFIWSLYTSNSRFYVDLCLSNKWYKMSCPEITFFLSYSLFSLSVIYHPFSVITVFSVSASGSKSLQVQKEIPLSLAQKHKKYFNLQPFEPRPPKHSVARSILTIKDKKLLPVCKCRTQPSYKDSMNQTAETLQRSRPNPESV